jgi:hypothetical protein
MKRKKKKVEYLERCTITDSIVPPNDPWVEREKDGSYTWHFAGYSRNSKEEEEQTNECKRNITPKSKK